MSFRMGEGDVCLDVLTDIAEAKESPPRFELKRDHQCLVDDTEPEPFLSKRQAKEVSNDDMRSEVSNPVISPKENQISFQDISSQPAELENSNLLECGDITSSCSGNLSSLSDGEHRENETCRNQSKISESAQVSRFVLEIPKEASSTGIKKITFRFSKRKEDCNYHSHGSVHRAVKGSYDEEHARMDDVYLDSSAQMYRKGAPNMELKMSKKVLPNNYPTNVKKLLSTGILDGARVKYISTTGKRELQGIINGGGYMCGCSSCNFSTVLSAYEFEQHAGVKTRHPNNHIFLDNGRPIYSVIQEIKTAPLSMLDKVIEDVAGASVNMDLFEAWKESFLKKERSVEAENNKIGLRGSSHPLLSCSSEALESSIGSTSCFILPDNPVEHHMHMEMVEEQKHVKKAISNMHKSVTQQKKSTGGAKKRDNDLHRLLFMPNGLPDGAELAYFVKGHRILGGYKQGNGIVCSHCDREVSPSQFEAHAGMAARRQPYRHIYTSNGLTLHDIAISLASGQSLTTGDSDDMCSACGDGGNLICCDQCPRAFHAACLQLECNPEGNWCCPNCKDKVGPSRKTVVGGTTTLTKPILIRLTRVVRAPEFEIGGCVVCRGPDFSVAKFDERTVILCDQCEREFHVGCLRNSGLCDLKELPKDKWFCCEDCNRIHVALQNAVSNGAELIPDPLSNIIVRKHAAKGLCIDEADKDVRWRILSGKSRYPEDLPLLSRTAAIFRECFDPIVAKSGRDLIPVMVYGRNISGQEFGGMYCVVLTVRSVVVSAALLRIFGRGVAELPIVATSRDYQGKGYFQALFYCIEGLLCSLNVENLVLPAAEEAESIWTKKLGFKRMSEEQLKKYMREVQLTIFKGTSMLEKAVPKMED